MSMFSMKEVRHSRTDALVSAKHPRLAQVINELAANVCDDGLRVEVIDDEGFELYVYELWMHVILREFVRDVEAAKQDPERAARLVPRHIEGDVYGGYEKCFVLRGGVSSLDEPLLDGVYAVRKGIVPGEAWRALRLDPPSGESIARALLIFLQEDKEDEEARRVDYLLHQEKMVTTFAVKAGVAPCWCTQVCIHGMRDCGRSSCQGGEHAQNCSKRQRA